MAVRPTAEVEVGARGEEGCSAEDCRGAEGVLLLHQGGVERRFSCGAQLRKASATESSAWREGGSQGSEGEGGLEGWNGGGVRKEARVACSSKSSAGPL